MKQLKELFSPILMILIIGTFVYTYFFYLKGDVPGRKQENEVETATIQQNNQMNAQMNDPNTAMVAGQNNPNNPWNMQEGDAFLDQQNKQNPLIMREHNPFGMRKRTTRLGRQVQQNVDPQAVANQIPVQPPVPIPDKVLQEGHWIGFEVIPLTPAIAKANNIPAEVTGVLVDEVTLVSVEVGLLAGDVITGIQGNVVKDLKSFKEATRTVAQSKQATVSIFRGGKYFNIFINSTEELGIAQMEAAPMILATAKSPHGYYGPCDRCHIIARTPQNINELAKDMGDSLVKIAPNIRRGTPPPHRNRGTCSKCHVIL